MKSINIGTLNTRVNRKLEEKISVGEDAMKYKIDVLGITETHNSEEELETFKIKTPYDDEKTKEYIYYNGGIRGENKYTGVGFVIDKCVNIVYIKIISDRIRVVEIDLGKEHKMIIINAMHRP